MPLLAPVGTSNVGIVVVGPADVDILVGGIVGVGGTTDCLRAAGDGVLAGGITVGFLYLFTMHRFSF